MYKGMLLLPTTIDTTFKLRLTFFQNMGFSLDKNLKHDLFLDKVFSLDSSFLSGFNAVHNSGILGT